jgi:hypothetical protein
MEQQTKSVPEIKVDGSEWKETSAQDGTAPKEKPRAKVFLGPGYSQMDWVKLQSKVDDLSGKTPTKLMCFIIRNGGKASQSNTD